MLKSESSQYSEVLTVLLPRSLVGGIFSGFVPPRPYSVTPSTATLAENACMHATVTFAPRETGEHGGELVLYYSTGEEVYTALYGNASDVNVRLDRTTVSLDNTFIGLSSQR